MKEKKPIKGLILWNILCQKTKGKLLLVNNRHLNENK